ncbi:unnamed protein product [Urochloa humidicola]
MDLKDCVKTCCYKVSVYHHGVHDLKSRCDRQIAKVSCASMGNNLLNQKAIASRLQKCQACTWSLYLRYSSYLAF